MIDYQAACKLVEQWLSHHESRLGTPVHILHEKTIEHEWGWIIYYHAKDPSKINPPESAKPSYRPFLVDRVAGVCTRCGPSIAPSVMRLFELRDQKLAQLRQDKKVAEMPDEGTS